MKIFAQFLIVAVVSLPALLIAQAPVANFSATDTAICDSMYIENFTDYSTNNPTNWRWYFPGATPDTSTLQNPTNIAYKGYGCYTVKLVVKNNNGSDSLIDSNYICLNSPPNIKLKGTRGCIGYIDTITASGGNRYLWSNGKTTSFITVGVGTSYFIWVKVYNGTCFKDTTFLLVADSMPSIRFKGSDTICAYQSTVIYALNSKTGKPGYGYSYLWNTGSTADSILINGLPSGIYTYYLTTTKGACTDSSQIKVDVRVCTGIENYSDPLREVKVYPNPSNGVFNLVVSTKEQGISEIQIYNVLGQQVYRSSITTNSTEINLNGQPKGVYLYRVVTQTGNLIGEGKVLIQH